MLKAVFVRVAREELGQGGGRVTHSALSVLSGVHRKDVRVLADAPPAAPAPRSIPLASQVYTRWLVDPAYRGPDGHPRAIARLGAEPSFEALARTSSSDVHPRTVLEELLRLGLVTLDGEQVVPAAAAFVPAAGLAELTGLFSANAGDHLAAAVHNLTADGPKFLEQSVFANGLSLASTQALADAARAAWAKDFEAMVGLARERIQLDKASPENHRIRFGVYFYSEPVDGANPPTVGAKPE
jgi:hypothetical protein